MPEAFDFGLRGETPLSVRLSSPYKIDDLLIVLRVRIVQCGFAKGISVIQIRVPFENRLHHHLVAIASRDNQSGTAATPLSGCAFAEQQQCVRNLALKQSICLGEARSAP